MTSIRLFLCAAIMVSLGQPCRAEAGPIGEPTLISGRGCRFPDAAYNRARSEYLVVWADYTLGARGIFGRRVTSDGEPTGEIFRISPRAENEAFFPAVVHSAASDEYLVTFDSTTGIQGQRVRGDGTLAGEAFAISATPGIRSAVAWSEKSQCALVVYYFPGKGGTDVYARRVSFGGEAKPAGSVLGAELNLSNDAPYSGYPSVAYAAAGDQFLVTWDHEPQENRGSIRGVRIAAHSGEPLGKPFDLASSGADSRSTIAYDDDRQRWLVQYNSARTKGNSYDQYGRFVATDGTLGDEIPIATSAAFEGDTLFGGDLAFVGGKFFASFARDGDATGMAGQELSAEGKRIGGQVTLGLGPYTCLSNAADTKHKRVLTVWEGLDGKSHLIRGRIFESKAGK